MLSSIAEATPPAQRDPASPASPANPDGLDASVRLARLRRRMFARVETPRIADYHVLRQIGGGGMGLVYAAWDPSLDRVIAIKVLRDPSSPKAAERLRREAVALARLRHSNVVPVYEVGEHEGQVYLAMEYVEGQTLREWTRRWRASSRSLPELLGVFVQAARALVAAHGAGLTHGDVKPENIMLDAEGRVRVMDFGLAREDAAEVTDERPSPSVGIGSVVTGHTRGLYGTPAYMAPEQFDGMGAGPAADQFALCACLFEALYGRRARPERLEEAIVVAPEPVVVPAQRGVPRRLQALLRRGLAVAPEQRWPSMRALADELSGLRRPRWGRAAAVAGLVIAAAGVAGGRAMAPVDPPPAPAEIVEPPCQAVPEVLVDDEDRTALTEVFDRLGTSSQAELGARVIAQLDRYAEEWSAMYMASCEATFVRREQSERVFDQRLQCLQRRRTRLRSAIDTLVTAPTTDQLGDRMMAAYRLPELEPCADVEALAAEVPLPVDPQERARVLTLRDHLDHAATRQDIGNYDEARELVNRAIEVARELDQPNLLSEGLNILSGVEASVGRGKAAEAAAREAIQIAVRAGDVRREALAWTSLVFAYVILDRSRDGLGLVFAATVAVERSGDEVARGWLLNNLGGLYSELRDFPRSVEVLRQAVEVKRAHYGDDHVDVGISWHNLAHSLSEGGRYQEALEAGMKARAIFESTVGRGHPLVIRRHWSECNLLLRLGRYDESAVACRAAMEGFERLGMRDGAMWTNLDLARAYWKAGRTEQAREANREMLARAEALGPFHVAHAKWWIEDPLQYDTLEVAQRRISAASVVWPDEGAAPAASAGWPDHGRAPAASTSEAEPAPGSGLGPTP